MRSRASEAHCGLLSRSVHSVKRSQVVSSISPVLQYAVPAGIRYSRSILLENDGVLPFRSEVRVMIHSNASFNKKDDPLSAACQLHLLVGRTTSGPPPRPSALSQSPTNR